MYKYEESHYGIHGEEAYYVIFDSNVDPLATVDSEEEAKTLIKHLNRS